MMEEEKKKKCFLSAIWESITKTGSCCGSGKDICSPSQPEKKEETSPEKKEETCCQDSKDKEKTSCCSS